MNMIRDKLFDGAILEMGSRVGLDWESFDDVLAYQENNGVTWYTTKTWTEAEQNDFKQWLTEYLGKHTRWSKKKIHWEVGTFILCYGWKVEYNE